MARSLLGGTPSDRSPAVLATGTTDVGLIFVSMSAREPSGRDADYLEWHSLDHRPEQHRLAGLRQSLRLVSTPACRAARAVSHPRYDRVDHVMTYFWTEQAALGPFGALSDALTGGRRPLALPSVEYGAYDLAGKAAAPRAVVGADVIPWRPALGVYLVVEEGRASPTALAEVAGVAGIWWHTGRRLEHPMALDRRGLQLTYCYLDQEPEVVAEDLEEPLRHRWSTEGVVPLLAAPFRTLVPFHWDRYLP